MEVWPYLLLISGKNGKIWNINSAIFTYQLLSLPIKTFSGEGKKPPIELNFQFQHDNKYV
jgi:hypothetical protein